MVGQLFAKRPIGVGGGIDRRQWLHQTSFGSSIHIRKNTYIMRLFLDVSNVWPYWPYTS